MYKNPVLLSSITHRTVRISPVRQYGFAKGMNSIVVLAQEFLEAAKQYPVLFSNSPQGELTPVIIVGLKDNLFITETGSWETGYYVPAFIRRYPYILSETDSAEGSLSVSIDTDFEGFDTPDGERLFTDDGVATPDLDRAVNFLRLFQEQYETTRAFVKHLVDLNIFKAVDANFALPSGDKYTLGGLSMIDEDALNKLSDSELVALIRRGYLPWLYAHLYSMTNFSTILNRMGNVVLQKED